MSKIKIGLALGSGGARGLAHIGVIKALEENCIPIDMIAGSSAGSLIGGLYSALGSIEEINRIAHSLNYKDLFWLFSDISISSGFVRGDKIENYLDKLLKHKTIESLRIPFASVATDVYTGEAIAIRHGSLARAIRASSSVPAIINTTYLENRYLIDGGASYPIPVKIVKDLGATHVIAVNLDVYNFIDSSNTANPKLNMKDVSIATLRLLRFSLAKELCRNADVTITPEVKSVSSINMVQFIHGDDIIKKGYDAALLVMPQIKKLL